MKSTFAFVALTYGKDCTSQIKEVALRQRRRFLLESYKKEVKIATEFLGGVFVEKLGAIRIQRRSLRKLASLNRKLEFWSAYERPRVTDLPGLYGIEIEFYRQLKGAQDQDARKASGWSLQQQSRAQFGSQKRRRPSCVNRVFCRTVEYAGPKLFQQLFDWYVRLTPQV